MDRCWKRVATGRSLLQKEECRSALAGWGYEVRSNLDVLIAYRRLSVNYDDRAFLFDAVQHGPGIGLNWRF